MYLSFTGTRDGMNDVQHFNVVAFVTKKHKKIRAAIHGDCIGADAQFHKIAADLGVNVEIHPSTSQTRAFCQGASKTYAPMKPLVRNKIMIQRAHCIIATPATNTEIVRSGTWHSIRYAKLINRPLVIFYPNGSIELCNFEENKSFT